jgi:hypothetical protein
MKQCTELYIKAEDAMPMDIDDTAKDFFEKMAQISMDFEKENELIIPFEGFYNEDK